MCVIAYKRRGVKLTEEQIRLMWCENPDGAGYMLARGGKVRVRKGFMALADLMAALAADAVSERDALVIHFRISTQAGVQPAMCHPFPVYPYRGLESLRETECECDVALAHNGVIRRTSCQNPTYSDTALFVDRYVSHLVRGGKDVGDRAIAAAIEALAPYNKFALMNGKGKVALIGRFERWQGLYVSNLNHLYPAGYYGGRCKTAAQWLRDYCYGPDEPLGDEPFGDGPDALLGASPYKANSKAK